MMLSIDFKIVCCVWCALGLYAAGQDTVPSRGERLAAENAASLREFEKKHGPQRPRRSISPEMEAITRNPDLLFNLKAEDLAKMSLDDPLLKYAYYRIFAGSIGDFNQMPQMAPQLKLVLADMRRRGEAVSPMLLKLIEENQESVIESAILGGVQYLDTVRIEPFLDYARRLLRERTKTMTIYSALDASGLLAQHGTKEDEALLEWVITEWPFVASSVSKDLRNLRARLNPPQPESRPERREKPSSKPGNNSRPATSSDESPENGNITTSRVKPWVIGGLILVALLGASRLLFKRPRGA
jgi:hypothetical protein